GLRYPYPPRYALIFFSSTPQSAVSPRARSGANRSSYVTARSPTGPRLFHSSIGVRLGPSAAVSSTPAANSSRRVRKHFSHTPQFSSLPGLLGQTRKAARAVGQLASSRTF